jgi:hypothetical protein
MPSSGGSAKSIVGPPPCFSRKKIPIPKNLLGVAEKYLSPSEYFKANYNDSNPHRSSALMRRIATLAIGNLIRAGKGKSVLDMYGSERTMRLIPDIDVAVHSEHIVAHDVASDVCLPNLQAEFLSYVDVYDIEEEEVLQCLLRSKARCAFICVLSIGRGGANEFGAAWKSNGITHYVTEGGDCLYTNSYPEWLYDGNKLLNVFRKRVVGPYDIFQVNICETNLPRACKDVPQLDQLREEHIEFSWDMIYNVSIFVLLFYRFRRLMGSPTMTWVYWSPVVAVNATSLSLAERTRFAQNTCHGMVSRSLESDPDYKMFRKLVSPHNLDLASQICFGTFSKVWALTRKRFRDHLKSTQMYGIRHDAEIAKYLDSGKVSYAHFFYDFLILVIPLILLLFGLYKIPKWILGLALCVVLAMVGLAKYLTRSQPTMSWAIFFAAAESGVYEEWFATIIKRKSVEIFDGMAIKAIEYNGPLDMPPMSKGSSLDQEVVPPHGHVTQFVYPIFQAMCPLPRPASGARNSYAMLRFRILAEPKCEADALYCNAYTGLFVTAISTFHANTIFSVQIEDMEDIIQALPKGKQKFARTNLTFIQNGTFSFNGKLKMQIFSKNNETIPWKTVAGCSHPVMVSRAVANVDPIANFALQVSARILSERFSNFGYYDGELVVHQYGWITFSYYYVKSFSALELSTVFNQMLTSQATIRVMILGDDSLAFRTIGGKVVVYENDFSQYDMTQRDVQQQQVKKIMTAFGLPAGCIALWERLIYEEKFSLRVNNSKWKGKRNPQQLTGIATTSVCNSILNLVATVSCHMMSTGQCDDLSQKYSKWGLSSKLNIVDPDLGPTFLRGWFVKEYNQNFYIWMPLPSQIVKLGKTIEKPTLIAHTKDWGEAYKRCAFILANSYAHLDPAYPILGIFIQRLLSESLEFNADQEVIEERKYKLRLDIRRFVDRAHVMNCMYARYDVTEKEILEAEDVIRKSHFPGIFGSTALEALFYTDYGCATRAIV